jgi:hypothetical protein
LNLSEILHCATGLAQQGRNKKVAPEQRLLLIEPNDMPGIYSPGDANRPAIKCHRLVGAYDGALCCSLLQCQKLHSKDNCANKSEPSDRLDKNYITPVAPTDCRNPVRHFNLWIDSVRHAARLTHAHNHKDQADRQRA